MVVTFMRWSEGSVNKVRKCACGQVTERAARRRAIVHRQGAELKGGTSARRALSHLLKNGCAARDTVPVRRC